MARLTPGVNDLTTTHPDLAAEWHPTKNFPFTASQFTAKSGKKVWWLGKCGHEWETAICLRTAGTGCPYCAGKKVLLGFNDLATTHPALAAQWHPTKNGQKTPQTVVAGSNKKAWWQCEKGHEWQAVIYGRANKNVGCPDCSSEMRSSFPEQAILYYMRKMTPAESRNTEFGKEIDVWLPDLRAGIEYNGPWHKTREQKDEKKVAFFADLGIRIITIKEGAENRIDGDVIEYIYSYYDKETLNWAISVLFERLNLPNPHIDAFSDASEIYDQYVQSEKKNSLAEKHPELVTEWHPVKNLSLTPNLVPSCSNKKVWWLGKCGHEWQMSPNDRGRGRNCPYCCNNRLLTGFNDLETCFPSVAAEWHPTKNGSLKPCDVMKASDKKVWWLGKCGHEWEASVGNRTKRKSGCPICGRKKQWEARRKKRTENNKK